MIYGEGDEKLLTELVTESNDYYGGMDLKLKYKDHLNVITDELLDTLEIINEDLPSYENLKKKLKRNTPRLLTGVCIFIFIMAKCL